MLGSSRRWMAGVAIALPLAAGLACGPAEQPVRPSTPAQDAAAPSQPAASAVAVKRGGMVTISRGCGAGDPHKVVAGNSLWAAMSDAPLWINESLKVELGIVKSWEISPNGLTYTFKVRDDVYFHDIPPVNGRQVTAADVAYTMMRATGKYNPEQPAALWPRFSALANMDKAEAVDKFTVKVTLTRPNGGFLLGMADGRLSVVPKEVVDAYGSLEQARRETLVSTGPFSVESCSEERGVVYKANPKYWKQGADGKPLPYLDEVRGVALRDRNTEVAALISGQISTMTSMLRSEIETVRRGLPGVQEIKLGGHLGCRLSYNMQRFPWSDLRVRRAVDLVLDRDMIGDGHLGKGYWQHESPAVGTQYPDWALPQEELLKLPGRKSGDARKPDIEQAKRLLKEAGITQLKVEVSGSGGAGSPSGYLEIPLIIVENLNRDLKDAGVTAVFDNFGANQSQYVAERRFDTNWFCPTLSTDPGLWLHEQYHTEGGRNYSGWSDPKYDLMWEKQQAELEPAKRKALMAEAQRYILDQVPLSLTYDFWNVTALQPNLRGVVPYFNGINRANVFTHLGYAWLDK